MQALIAILTGAGGGIGREMLKALVQAGISVVAVDRDAHALEQSEAAAREDIFRAVVQCLALDLAGSGAADAIVNFTLEQFGRVDLLINNAGIGPASLRANDTDPQPRFWELPDSSWLNFFEVNTHAAFRLSQRAARRMIAQGSGRIVNVTTSFGTMIRGSNAPYGPTKAATEALSAIMAADLEGTGVTVNVLVPGGMTNTPMVSGIGYDRAAMLQPDIMAPPLLWLISEEARTVTGRRFIAAEWDSSLPGAEAAAQSGAGIAWPDLGKPRHPPKIG